MVSARETRWIYPLYKIYDNFRLGAMSSASHIHYRVSFFAFVELEIYSDIFKLVASGEGLCRGASE